MFYLPNEKVENSEDSKNKESNGECHLRQALRQVWLPSEEDPQRLHDHQKAKQHQISGQAAARIGKN